MEPPGNRSRLRDRNRPGDRKGPLPDGRRAPAALGAALVMVLVLAGPGGAREEVLPAASAGDTLRRAAASGTARRDDASADTGRKASPADARPWGGQPVDTAARTETAWEAFLGERPAAPSLKALRLKARKRSPLFAAGRARVEAAEGEALRAGAFAPPEVGLMLNGGPAGAAPSAHGAGGGSGGAGDEKGRVDYGFYARQMLMFPGKVAAMSRGEARRRAMASLENEALELGRDRDIAQSYYALYLLQKRGEAQARNLRLLRAFSESMRRRYEAGLGRLEELLRVRGDLSRAEADLSSLRQEYLGREAVLASLLGEEEMLLGPIATLAEGDSPPELGAEGAAGLKDRIIAARAHRPELKAMDEEAAMAEWESEAGRREYWPDLMVEGEWMPMEGGDSWRVMTGITVPIAPWASQGPRGAAKRGRARLAEARAGKADMELRVVAEVRSAHARLLAAEKRLEWMRRSTLPLAEQGRAAAEAGFRAGASSYLAVLDAYRLVLAAQEEVHAAEVDRLLAAADLRAATGKKELP